MDGGGRGSVWEAGGEPGGSARLALPLDEGLDEGDHDVLLTAGELRGHLEDLLEPPHRTGLSRLGGGAKEVLDADAEGLGHLGQYVGVGGFAGGFPIADVLLGDADDAGQLGLAEACVLAELDEAGAKLGSRTRGSTGHEEASIGLDFGRGLMATS